MNARLALLVLLAGWSVLLSLESWGRRPGDPRGMELPDRLVRQGRVHERRGLPDPGGVPALRAELPEGVVLLEVAHYRPQGAEADPAAEIRLLHLVHTRTGRSGVMPVEAIAEALADAGGRCIVPAPDGGIERELRTSAAWRQWRASREARSSVWMHRLTWMAGLRPYGDNTCLWMSAPGAPPQGSQ